MSKVKISTLTPIHVGSGNLLQNNTDFVKGSENGNSFLYVIDPKKIMSIIGTEHINDWVHAIERKENTVDFVKVYSSNSQPQDYSQRSITNYVDRISSNDTLKECIHNGMGLACIPGSSIKGAIRTAVLASLVANVDNAEQKIKDFKGKVNAKQIESELFGKDPNSDVFRFIQVGDAYFEKDCEIATRVVNLNQTHKDSLKDNSKPQIVEAIGVDYDSEFQMKVAREYYDFVKRKFSNVGKLTQEMQSVNSLFDLINRHTKNLVQYEIEYWNSIDKSGAEAYIENMENILTEVDNCQTGKECVLRIGHASGWRFITGAWTEKLDNFSDVVVPASRPKNFQYLEYDFPKSRRLDTDGDILGFVKLSLK